MFDSNYPSNKKRNPLLEDITYLPTAERSHYRHIQRTPKREDGSNRVASAQRSIDHLIEQVSAKKNMNRQAIEEVRGVNQEIASSLSSFNPAKSHPSVPNQKNRTADGTRDQYSRELVANSHFEWQDQFRPTNRNSASLTNQNDTLKSRLAEQAHRNNELLRYVKKLEGENAQLCHSQIAPINADMGSMLEENRYLKNQLQNGASMPIDLLQQLGRLKEQNDLLRRDTISLLKKTS